MWAKNRGEGKIAWEFHNQQQSYIKGEILVALPYKQNFSAKFLTGVLSVQFPEAFSHSFLIQTGQPLDISRNLAVSNALQRRNVSHIFFLDEDVILKPETIISLKNTNMPFVGATYYSRSPPYNVTANINQKPITRDMIVERRKNHPPNSNIILEVTEIGMGACLIDTRVFKRIAEHNNLKWLCLVRHDNDNNDDTATAFDNSQARALNYRCNQCNNTLLAKFFDYRLGKEQEDSLSEDYYFCKLARKTGFSVYLDVNTEVGHEITMFTINTDGLENSTLPAGIA